MNSLSGKSLGKYQVITSLGQGGMAEVYQAYQPGLNRHVALKVLHAHLTHNPDFIGRFEREAAAIARLRHPNIVQVHDFDVHDQWYYMVMEYIEGPTLKAVLHDRLQKQAPFSLEETVRLFSEIADAVDYAHSRNMVHRDLKPANIMFTPEGQALLTDFGIARILNDSFDTNVGSLVGTAAYLSPEQAQGERGSERSDVYALGIILYELLTGQVPFDGDLPVAVIAKHVNLTPPPMKILSPDVPPAVEQVVLKALRKKPTERYLSAGEMAFVLREAAGMTQILSTSKQLAQLQELLTEPAPGVPPFKGLQHFEESDAHLYFGREALIQRLAQQLHSHNFLAVLGASGSGKSSLVRAGLLPTLRQIASNQATWQIHVITPTAHPMRALAMTLSPTTSPVSAVATLMDALTSDARALDLAAHRLITPGQRLLLIVDQFEEIFTLCRSETERQAFINNLIQAAAPETSGPVTVVLTLRADFYAQCGPYRQLCERLATEQEYVSPMTVAELRQAIEEPARRGEWSFEPGLVALLLRDIGADSPRQLEPGALPLLSHALLETWKRRRGRLLTLKGYEEAGGARGAIARTAETVYAQLSGTRQNIARQIFIRLTELGEGAPDTRRRVNLEELLPQPDQPQAAANQEIHTVLKTLADARLITINADTVEVAHEALIREWPTLRVWLDADRAGLQIQRHCAETSREWARLNYPVSELYRGARLATATEWAATHPQDFNSLERRFLAASNAEAQREATEREAQRQRELQAAQQLAETETQRAQAQANAAQQFRRGMLVLGLLAFIAILAAVAYYQSNQTANQAAQANATLAAQNEHIAQAASTQEALARQQAIELATQKAQAQAIAVTAENNFRRAEAQRLAAEANALIQNQDSAELAALLAIRSSRLRYSPQGDTALLNALNLDYPIQIISSTVGIFDLDFSPDGNYLFTSNSYQRTAGLIDIKTGQEIRTYGPANSLLNTAQLSPDGRLGVTTSESEPFAQVWDIATGQEVFQLISSTITSTLRAATFSPDGKFIATVGREGQINLWGAQNGQFIRAFLGATGPIWSVAFSPDGQWLATGGDTTVQIWEVPTGQLVTLLNGHTSPVKSIVFSSDSQKVLTGGDDTTLRLWSRSTGETLQVFKGHTGGINTVLFAPDGLSVLSAGYDRTLRTWEITTGQETRRRSVHNNTIRALTLSLNGRYLASTGDDQTIRIWDLETPAGPPQFKHDALVGSVAFSPIAPLALTGSSDKTARVWDITTGELQHVLTSTEIIQVVAFSPDGTLAALGSWGGPIRLYTVQTGQLATELNAPNALALAFAPDGKTLFSGGWSGEISQWDLASGEVTRPLTGHTSLLYGLAVSPNGQYLLSSSYDQTSRVWDLQTGQTLFVLDDQGNAGVNAAAFSHDGRFALTSNNNKLARVWDLQTGQNVLTLTGHTDIVWSASFSPDDKQIITSSSDKTVQIWDARTGERLRRLNHTTAVEAVAFSPDGKYILAGTDSGLAYLWPADYLETINTLCAHLQRDLSRAERVQYELDETPTCSMP